MITSLSLYHAVAIDVTGLHSYSNEPYQECPYREYKDYRKAEGESYARELVTNKGGAKNEFLMKLIAEKQNGNHMPMCLPFIKKV